mmetsp:Transcript_28562/g.94778  ORF Transcript_28562/g.94778 Transcript_28562/m.94778 type:complete len:190 (-) Transcript_28562:96-665(-)
MKVKSDARNPKEVGRTKLFLEMWSRKLGLQGWSAEAAELWERLAELMQRFTADYTLLWRQLSELPCVDPESSDSDLVGPMLRAFYDELPRPGEMELAMWVSSWLKLLAKEGQACTDVAQRMKRVSPKYIPREWMLVEAYTAAERGNHTPVHVLHQLLKRPYEEQPEYESLYYRRAPDGSEKQGGIGFMS